MPVIFTNPFAGGGVSDHSALTGLLVDDHKQYILVDGSRGFTSTVAGVMPTQSYHLVTREYADTLSGTGQTNIASNLGSGEGIFFQKVGVDLQFKSLVGGDNIVLSADNDTITISGASGGGTSDHSLLSNLDYASSGHAGFQPAGDYITGTEITTISGDIISQIPTDFYTQFEITTISGDIVAQFPTDFYTQSEVDTISGALDVAKSDVGHTHTESDITDLGDYATNAQLTTTSGDIVSQIPNDYLTGAEMTTISGDIVAQIPTDFYTTTEVDTLVTTTSGDIVSQIPTDFYTQAEITTISGDIVAQIGEGGVTNHSELDELDYASAGHTGFQPAGDYATTVELTTTSGDIVTQIPSDFYSTSEVDTISGALQTQVDGKADTSHTHDDRYFTESEITTISGDIVDQIPSDFYSQSEITTISGDIVSQIPSVVTNHSELDELDYASAGHTGFQPAGDYITGTEITTISGDIVSQIPIDFYTQSEVTTISGDIVSQIPTDYLTDAEMTTISGDLQTQIDSKSDTGHTHDDRYYTETEIDNFDYATVTELATTSGDLQTNVDGKSDLGHTHTESDITDLDKYTQAEVDALITTISGKLDDHDELNNLDYASSGHTGFQASGDYATNTQLTTTSGDIVSQIPSDFYSQSEITTISGDIVAQIPTDYISDAEMTTISGDIVAQIPTDFYTQAEIATISGDLSAEIDSDISTHSASGDHDGRYYTETEIDNFDFLLTSEMTTISGDIVDQIPTDYYTTGEVDTISGALSTEIDSDISTFQTDYLDGPLSPQRLTGFELSEGTNVGTGKVASGTALLRTTDSESGALIKISLSEQDNVTITASGVDYRVVLEYNSGTPQIVLQEAMPNYTTDITLGKFRREPNNTVHYKSTGRRLNDGVAKLHRRAERIRPWEMSADIQIADEGAKKWSISAGQLYKGINEIEFAEFDTTISGHVFTYVYYDGADWIYVEDQTEINVDQYNNVATGLATCNKYKCDWVFIHPDDDHVYVVYGQDNSTIGNIEASAVPNVPDLVDTFGMLVGRIIIDGGTAAFEEIQMVQTTTFNVTTVAVHNDLSGLQGGTADQYYHLTSAQRTDLTDGGETILHIHDDRYYTESEVDTVSGSLNDKINNLDYYTTGEVDTISGALDAAKSALGHTHTESDITDLGDYATTLELTTASGDLQTNIDDKSDIGHTHTESDITDLGDYATNTQLTTTSGDIVSQIPSDFYTQAEVTTISGDLSDEIDSDISTHAASADHDGRYYTETELNAGQLDNRYYTESEVTTISGDLQTNIDAKDNYSSWSFAIDGVTKDAVTSGDVLDFVGGDNITITRSADDQITISGGIATTAQKGIADLATNDESKTVDFGWAFDDTEYALTVAIENVVDAIPSIYSYTISDTTVSGFTIDFSGPIDSNNYKLHWQAMENLASIITDIDHGSLLGLTEDNHEQYLLADGTRNIGGNITQDGGLYIATDEIRATSVSGLALKDDAGNLGIFIEDGGKVGIGGVTNPTSSLDVKSTLGFWNTAEDRGIVQTGQAEYVDWSYYNGAGWTSPMAMSDLKTHMSVDFMDGWVGIGNLHFNTLNGLGNIYTAGNVGINTAPSYPLHIVSTPGDVDQNTTFIDVNSSGTLTTDREHVGVLVDVDSTIDEDGNGLTLRGIRTDVLNSGDATTVQSMNPIVEHNSAGTVTNLASLWGNTRVTAGLATSAYGTRNRVRVLETGAVTTAYAMFGQIQMLATGKTVGTAYGFKSQIDQTDGTITTGYLFHGAYTGTVGTKWGIRLVGETKSQFDGQLGLGVDPSCKFDINSSKFRLRNAKTPSSAGDTGNQGDICWDATYIYICVATNTWERVEHVSW